MSHPFAALKKTPKGSAGFDGFDGDDGKVARGGIARIICCGGAMPISVSYTHLRAHET